MANIIVEKKRKLEVAQHEYQKAVEVHRNGLLAQRADIDRQLAELDAANSKTSKSSGKTPQPSGKRRTGPSRKRRTGIRADVLAYIKAKGSMARAQVLKAMNAQGNKSLTGSIDNALGNLKKSGVIKLADGNYTVK